MISSRRALLALPLLAALLVGCRGGNGPSEAEREAIRATIDPTAWILTLVLPDAAAVEVATGVTPAAFHTVEYDPEGRFQAVAVDDQSVTIAAFDLHLFPTVTGPVPEGGARLGRIGVHVDVPGGEIPQAAASALSLATMVNVQDVIDLDYTPPATPDSLIVGLNMVQAFEDAGREWLAALEAGDLGHTPRALATCEDTRDFGRALWMFIARPCVEYGRAGPALLAGDGAAAIAAVREGIDRTSVVVEAMGAAID